MVWFSSPNPDSRELQQKVLSGLSTSRFGVTYRHLACLSTCTCLQCLPAMSTMSILIYLFICRALELDNYNWTDNLWDRLLLYRVQKWIFLFSHDKQLTVTGNKQLKSPLISNIIQKVKWSKVCPFKKRSSIFKERQKGQLLLLTILSILFQMFTW